jgi:hypothetical protein
MRMTLVVFVVGLASVACKKKSDHEAAPAAAPAAGRPAADTEATPPPARPNRQNYPRLSLATLTVDEIAPMMPKAKGKPIADPIVQAGGRQVRQSFCLDAGELEAIAGDIQKELTANGFTASPPRKRGKEDKPRVVVSGQKGEYRVSVNVIPSINPACKGKPEALITFHRVIKRMPGEAGAPGAGATDAPADPAAAPPATHAAPSTAPAAPAPAAKP